MPPAHSSERSPREETGSRLARWRGAALSLSRSDALLANTRLAVFLAATVLAWLAFVSRAVDAWLTAPVLLLFIVLVGLHDSVIRRRTRAERAVAYWASTLDRINDVWIGKGDPGIEFTDPGHGYADDLDLFGKGSVFERISAARTSIGRETLARWLLRDATREEILDRQGAVAELRDSLDLREDLATLGTDLSRRLDPESLRRWVAAPPAMSSPALPWISGGLALASLVCLAGWLLAGFGPMPLVALLLVQAGVSALLHRRVEDVIGRADRPAQELRLLAGILARIEEATFVSPRLRSLQSGLETGGSPPSRRIADLARMSDRLEWGRNTLFAPIAFVLMWMPLHAWGIDRWRRRHGARVADWLRILGEMEALASLGGYAFENPDDPFPEICADEAPLFEAQGIGHPLLPARRCVRNDLRLDATLRLLVVSGSNMSGKSTLLRAVGVNALLALAGAPVRAVRLRISPLAVGASIRRQDSLQDGTSRFYAEIQRLRELMTVADQSGRLIFLIDEIFNGTNSHDRRVGAEGVLRGFIRRGSIGIVTTHDLAITQIATDLHPAAANVHFEDRMEEGRIAFDYLLRPGVVDKSNALALMRAVGLDLGEDDPR